MIWEERRSGWKVREGDARSEMDADYARVVHSASFRRLQGKTQILNLGDSDFYRTRLTHSLEVAQIAGSVTRQLRHDNEGHPAIAHLPDLTMIQAIGFTHDLGHPPFGHGGEVALNYCMRNHGGFEGNGQTLRILSKLEKFSAAHGADLTRRTLLGTLKYPVQFSRANNPDIVPSLVVGTSTVELVDRKLSKPPKCYMNSEQDVVDWILKPLTESDRSIFTSVESVKGKHGKALHKSFDCSIMDLADDIAFGVHDFEDALALKLISEDDFRQYVLEEACTSHLDALKQNYPDEFGNDVYDGLIKMLFGNSRTRKHAISRMVGHFNTNCIIDTIEEIEEPVIRYRAGMRPKPRLFLDALKKLVYDVVILSPAVQHLEFKGQRMVIAVFEVFQSEPKAFLPRDTFEIYRDSPDPVRVICDHVSGMTDAFLLRTYDRLFSPRMGSVFDKH